MTVEQDGGTGSSITSLDGLAFETALANLAAIVASDRASIVDIIVRAFEELATAVTLARRERDRRVRVMLLRLRPTVDEYQVILPRVRAGAPEILNGLRGVLPAELR